MTTDNQLLLDILSNALFDRELSLDDNYDFSEVFREALNQSVLPLVFDVVAKKSDVSAYSEWKQRSQFSCMNNMRIEYEHVALDQVLGDIPYVILKGNVSASYYPKLSLRMMGDVDFLVHEEDVARARKVLTAAGYIAEEDNGGIHIAFAKLTPTGGVSIEMHRRVNGIPSTDVGETIKGYLADIWDTSSQVKMSNGSYVSPDAFHHGLVMLLHTASHLTAEGIGLRHLCDWAVFVEKFSNEEFCDMFETKLNACGLWKFAQVLSNCSVKYLGCTYKAWMETTDEELLEGLIEDILEAGNFGHKDEDRSRQIKYISNRGEGTVDSKSGLKQVISTIKVKAEQENKTQVGVVVDYIGKVLKGERKLDSDKTIKRADERKKTYSEFELYHKNSATVPRHY